MRKTILCLCAVVLIVSGCVTTPPAGSMVKSATPASEYGYSGHGPDMVPQWTDDQARTALWLRRNFPDRWGELPFPLINLFRYNMYHYDRQQIIPVRWEYYFANIRDPYLQVRMSTLDARDRNEMRRNDVIAREAARKAAAEKAITGEVSELSDREVLDKLQTVYP